MNQPRSLRFATGLSSSANSACSSIGNILSHYMFGIFKSAEKKRLEADRDLVIRGIRELAQQNLNNIRFADDTFSAAQNRHIANRAFLTAMDFDRTKEALSRLEASIRKLDAEGKLENSDRKTGTSIGMMLAYRMISGGHLLSRVDSSHWFEVATEFAPLEGSLRGFLGRQGVSEWSVPYVEDVNFERYRRDFAAKESSAE